MVPFCESKRTDGLTLKQFNLKKNLLKRTLVVGLFLRGIAVSLSHS